MLQQAVWPTCKLIFRRFSNLKTFPNPPYSCGKKSSTSPTCATSSYHWRSFLQLLQMAHIRLILLSDLSISCRGGTANGFMLDGRYCSGYSRVGTGSILCRVWGLGFVCVFMLYQFFFMLEAVVLCIFHFLIRYTRACNTFMLTKMENSLNM